MKELWVLHFIDSDVEVGCDVEWVVVEREDYGGTCVAEETGSVEEVTLCSDREVSNDHEIWNGNVSGPSSYPCLPSLGCMKSLPGAT